jgi:hypothetical protein
MSKSPTRQQSRFQARKPARMGTITHLVNIFEGQGHCMAPCRSGSVPWKTVNFGPLSDVQTVKSVDPGQTNHQSSGYYICINRLQRTRTNGAILGELLDEQSRFLTVSTHWPPWKNMIFTNRPNQSKDAAGNRLGHPSDSEYTVGWARSSGIGELLTSKWRFLTKIPPTVVYREKLITQRISSLQGSNHDTEWGKSV